MMPWLQNMNMEQREQFIQEVPSYQLLLNMRKFRVQQEMHEHLVSGGKVAKSSKRVKKHKYVNLDHPSKLIITRLGLGPNATGNAHTLTTNYCYL
jgi:hypothetical protein